jgi:hypothetical protein
MTASHRVVKCTAMDTKVDRGEEMKAETAGLGETSGLRETSGLGDAAALREAAPEIVEASEGILAVHDHRIRFQYTGSHESVDLPVDQIRRVQVDLELGRPASVAIVPNSGTLDVRLLTVERSQFEHLAAAILRLAVAIDDAGSHR